MNWCGRPVESFECLSQGGVVFGSEGVHVDAAGAVPVGVGGFSARATSLPSPM